MRDALCDVLAGNSSLWRELSRVTRQGIASIEELVTVADDTDIDFSDATSIKTLHEDACKLKEHMQNGGKLGWWLFRPKTVKDRLHVLRTVRIGGRPCSTVCTKIPLRSAKTNSVPFVFMAPSSSPRLILPIRTRALPQSSCGN